MGQIVYWVFYNVEYNHKKYTCMKEIMGAQIKTYICLMTKKFHRILKSLQSLFYLMSMHCFANDILHPQQCINFTNHCSFSRTDVNGRKMILRLQNFTMVTMTFDWHSFHNSIGRQITIMQ